MSVNRMIELKQDFIKEPVHQDNMSLLLFITNTDKNPEFSIIYKKLDTLNYAKYKMMKN